MHQVRKLQDDFPEQYKCLIKLFGEREVRSKACRLDQIHQVCEKAWGENTKRLSGTKVKYLLIAEAPPWSEGESVRYFYLTFNKDAGWITGVWNVFYENDPPKTACEYLNQLAKKGFLLIDSLPFAMPYTTPMRKRPSYKRLVECCSDYVEKKISDPMIKWSEDVKVAFAFKHHGRALLETFPRGITLPTGRRVPFQKEMIAATSSGFPTRNSLRTVWGMQNDG